MTTSATTLAAALRLREAVTSRTQCLPVRDLLGADNVAGAYAVQETNIQHRRAAGLRRVGRKIGLTSASARRQFGDGAPDSGSLLSDMGVPAGGIVAAGLLFDPRVEGELAFRISRDIWRAPDAAADLRRYVGSVAAAIEIVDTRVVGWDLSAIDTIADNASSGLFVVGADEQPLEEVDPSAVLMQIAVDGAARSSGSGAECLGGPLNALLWLSRHACAQGDPLRAGEIVLSGALGPMVPVAAGETVQVSVTGFEVVEVTFAGPGDVDPHRVRAP